MRKVVVVTVLVAINVGSLLFWEEADEVIAWFRGSPVHLISSTAPLDIPDTPDTFTHVFLHDGNLRIVIRGWFYDSEELGRPFFTVDEEHSGLVHIPTKPHFDFIQKNCEYLRQFEIELQSKQWRPLKSLRVYNDDTKLSLSDELPISDSRYLQQLLLESQQQIASEKQGLTSGGC